MSRLFRLVFFLLPALAAVWLPLFSLGLIYLVDPARTYTSSVIVGGIGHLLSYIISRYYLRRYSKGLVYRPVMWAFVTTNLIFPAIVAFGGEQDHLLHTPANTSMAINSLYALSLSLLGAWNGFAVGMLRWEKLAEDGLEGDNFFSDSYLPPRR